VTVRAVLRAGVVGAARRRRGIGEHHARHLHAAGATVVAVAGTSLATAREAAAALADRHGIRAEPYPDAAAMLAGARLDLLVVASPPETHAPLVRAALDAGAHVLCEKPFLEPGPGAAEEAARLAKAFAERGRLLAVATPWRHALPAWMRLFPDAAPRSATRFAMRLSPSVDGPAMLPDSLPHALALADHLFGAPETPLAGARAAWASRGDATVSFSHPGGRGGVACEVRLVTCPEPPRPLSIAFDGRVAERRIREPGYAMSLVDPASGREVPLPDPLEALVRDVVARVRRGPPFPEDRTIASGARGLERILEAARAVAASPGGG
jgi:predicted dehydrogenase